MAQFPTEPVFVSPSDSSPSLATRPVPGLGALTVAQADVAAAHVAVASGRPIVADLSLLLVTAIWGTTFVIVKEALAVFPPFTYIAIRFTLATLTLALIAGGRMRSMRPDVARGAVLIGAFMFAGFALQTFSLRVTSASTAAFLTGLNVVIVPFVAYLWLRQRPGTGALVGVVAATVGLGLISIKDDFSLAVGDLLAVGCALAFALQIVGVGKYIAKADALAFTLVQLVTVTAGAWIAVLAFESPTIVVEPSAIGSLLFISVVATALVFCIQNAAQRFTSPTHTALIFTMEPVFAAFFAWLWLGEHLSERGAVGGVLIIAGTLAAELWPKK
jgi:drug/metabolite transporter (DMT)-like permease